MDHDLTDHLLVPIAAEHVAMERKGTQLVWSYLDPCGSARLDGGLDPQIGRVEAMCTVERGQLESHGFALLELDDSRREFEFLGRDSDDRFSLGAGHAGGQQHAHD